MARKLFGQSAETDAESTDNETNESNDTQETTTMSTATEEAPVTEATESADNTAAEATESEAVESSAETDLTEFEAAVAAAIEARDEATGKLPEAVTAPVTKAYQALSVGGKSKAKAHLLAIMTEGVETNDSPKAMAANELRRALVPAKTSGTPKPKAEPTPVDPNEGVALQLAPLRVAFNYLSTNLPEGAEAEGVKAKTGELFDSSNAEIQGYLNWLDREAPAEGEEDTPEPEVSVVTKKAARLIRTKVKVATSGTGKTYSGPKRSIATHIEQVFASFPSGHFMTINEIAKAESAEYGEDRPSSGAVSARLFPTDGDPQGNVKVGGVTSGVRDNKRGAIKD